MLGVNSDTPVILDSILQPEKVPPKPRGITGARPMAETDKWSGGARSVSLENNLQPLTTAPNLPKDHLPLPSTNTIPPPASPVKSFGPKADGPKLLDWFSILDADMDEDEEHTTPLVDDLLAQGIRRVKDLNRHSAEDLVRYTACTIGLACRIKDYATSYLTRK
jgi:hypothetical protein